MLASEKAKVIVVGDSGVGKTALVHLLCHQSPLLNPRYTVGCSLKVKVHHFRTESNQDHPFLIDLWDIGGSNAHANARSVFYNCTNGVLLVYDCTNNKSQRHLRQWFSEVLYKTPNGSLESVSYGGPATSDRTTNLVSFWSQNTSGLRLRNLERSEEPIKKPDDSFGSPLPLLVVGTKVDLLDSTDKRRKPLNSYSPSPSPQHVSGGTEVPAGPPKLLRFPGNTSVKQSTAASIYVNLYGASSNVGYISGLKKTCSNVAEEFGCPEIFLSCKSASYIAPNSWNATILDRFFDDVVRTNLSHSMGYTNYSPDSSTFRKFTSDSGDQMQSSSLTVSMESLTSSRPF